MAYETVELSISPEDGWVLAATDPAYLYIKPGLNVPWYLAVTASGAPGTAYVAAAGTITYSGGVPTADDTITVGDDVYTFKASADDDFEIEIGGDEAATAANTITAINTFGTSGVTASDGGAGIVDLEAVTAGEVGNSIALTEDADNTAVSGSGTLTGGLDPVLGLMMQGPPGEPKQAFEKVGATTAEFYIRVLEYAQPQPGRGVPFKIIRDES
jgi:hypothetical protein